MPSILIRICLFLASYSPIALILFVLHKDHHFLLSLLVLLAGILGIVFSVLYLLVLAPRQSPRPPKKVTSVRRSDGEILAYVASYIIPFLTVSVSTPEQRIAFAILVGVIIFVSINSNVMHVNPILIAMMLHVYEVTFEKDPNTYYVIARHIELKEQPEVVFVGESVLLAINSWGK